MSRNGEVPKLLETFPTCEKSSIIADEGEPPVSVPTSIATIRSHSVAPAHDGREAGVIRPLLDFAARNAYSTRRGGDAIPAFPYGSWSGLTSCRRAGRCGNHRGTMAAIRG